MKKVTVFLVFAIIYITGCRNDKTDDTRIDSALAAPPLSPLPDTMNPGVDSAMITKADNTSTEKKSTISPERKNSVEDGVRVKKVSKKGRIILELLKLNMQEKIASDNEGVYNRAEVMPYYPGGESALREFIENNIAYPDNALNNDIHGTVKVYFAVDEQGKIYAPVIISPKLGYGLEEEALRVVKRMPKWIPGQVEGKNVKTRFTLPITYKID